VIDGDGVARQFVGPVSQGPPQPVQQSRQQARPVAGESARGHDRGGHGREVPRNLVPDLLGAEACQPEQPGGVLAVVEAGLEIRGGGVGF